MRKVLIGMETREKGDRIEVLIQKQSIVVVHTTSERRKTEVWNQ